MRCGLKNCGASIFLAVLVGIGQVTLGQSATATHVVLNLRTYGWEPDGRSVDRPSIAVDHEDRVLVGFTVRERTGLVTRGQPSLDFRIVRLLPSGKTDLSLSLPTNAAGRTGTYLSDTDQIIARANDSLQLFQADVGKPEAGIWKTLVPCGLQCYPQQSVSRHTLLLYTTNADPPVTLIRLSQQPTVQHCGKAHQSPGDSIQNFPQSITDKFAYFEGSEGLEPFTYRWPLCDFEHRVELPLRIGGRWIVLNDDLFVVTPFNSHMGRWGLEVISFDGRLRFRADLAKHESAVSLWAPIRSSERRDRIAVEMVTIRGANRALDLSGHVTARRVAVYDIEAAKELASVPVNPRNPITFDLSPDGRRLAILEYDAVKVVNLDAPPLGLEHR
jgi:hypothetical protein